MKFVFFSMSKDPISRIELFAYYQVTAVPERLKFLFNIVTLLTLLHMYKRNMH